MIKANLNGVHSYSHHEAAEGDVDVAQMVEDEVPRMLGMHKEEEVVAAVDRAAGVVLRVSQPHRVRAMVVLLNISFGVTTI